MKLRTKYLLFVCILHAIALFLSFLVFEKNKLFFLLSEVFILGSILISWQLYNQMIRPLRLLVQGAEAIRDRDFTVKFVESGTFEMDELVGVYNQMIEELRKERTLQQEQHFFLDKLIFSSPVGIVILDHDQRVQQVNPAAKKILHTIPFEGWLLKDIDHPIIDEVRLLMKEKSKAVTLNSGAETYKVQVSEFLDQGFPRNFVIIQELTTELLEAEKQAYGKVIRMMAHEVNNTIGPVNSIMDSAMVIESERSPNSRLADALQVAIDRNNNLNIFMRNLADVVRLPEPSKQYVDLHDLIYAVTTLLSEMAREKNTSFEFAFHKIPLVIFADQLQMEQVLINVVKNAIEAIDVGKQGIITFVTENLPQKLIVRDNGKGISAEAEAQLFSPFFSTKADGQGIGLTLIKDILIKHGFSFALSANQKGETEFSIVV
ncbi:histidine kinase [Pedobacter sp. KBW06]|uniref:sensor histidine kinase n=1 Tax=Pedobacter sp. KBW06 TaxID=2153359 RepID=UPI000F5B1BF1|nr:ATP-binding protein [Pedobacter sp. KBW06]RQO68030.1 histidine kinase [Pedobacter sp. KBW06]